MFLFVRQYLCMFVRLSVCPSLRPFITSHMKHMHNNWIKQLFSFPFHYMTLAIDKLNGCGLSNSVRLERLPKKTKITWY